MTHKYLILILFCTWGPPLRFIGCSRMDAKAIVNAICHENSAACLPWFIFCKHIIKDHPAVIGASSSFFPRQCLLWVPAIGWKEGAHIDVYTPPPHFFHALVTCKTEFYFACLIFYSSMEGSHLSASNRGSTLFFKTTTTYDMWKTWVHTRTVGALLEFFESVCGEVKKARM